MAILRTCVIIALPLLVASARLRGDAAADDDGSGDDAKAAIQKQLSSVLAAGNAKLQAAEQEHEKTLSGVRTAAGADLIQRASVLGAVISAYAYELKQAQSNLSSVINATQAGLDQDMGDIDTSVKARLGALISVATRQLKRAQRRHDGIIEISTRSVNSVLEKEADTITDLWVGDLTPKLTEAEKKLQEVADAPAPGSPEAIAALQASQSWDDDDGLMDVLKANGLQSKPDEKKADVKPATPVKVEAKPVVKVEAKPVVKVAAADLEKNIRAAGKALDADTKVALKKVEDAVSKQTTEVKTYVDGVKKELKDAQKKATDLVSKQ